MTTWNDFKDFSEQDFINDPGFQDWITCPDEEKDAFWQGFLTAYPHKRSAVEKARTLLKAVVFTESWPADEQVERSLTEALATINKTGQQAPVYQMQTKRRPFYQSWWAAAAVLLVLATGGYFLWQQRAGRELATVPETQQPPLVNDVAPGGDKAILILGDGTRVVLDTADNGAVAKQGAVTVIKLDGQLAYQPAAPGPAATQQYNTIATPKGGQYQMVLSDGTKVWLNAASSMRFPVTFAGGQRLVEITGEAYFEVAHNALMPFVVKKGAAEVKVLGTHFNVNAYDDEAHIKVTLLEGKVRVGQGRAAALLKPGQQAQIPHSPTDAIEIANDVDLEETVAWKNGKFQFGEAAEVEEVLRQLSRWYNVEFEYQGDIKGQIGGTISRNVPLSQVLSLLEMTGVVAFELKGRSVEVRAQ